MQTVALTSHTLTAQSLVAGVELTSNRQTIRNTKTTLAKATRAAKARAKPHQDPLALQSPKEEALLLQCDKPTHADLIMAFALKAQSRNSQQQALFKRQVILARADTKLISHTETKDANTIQAIQAQKKAEHEHHSSSLFPSWVGWVINIAPASLGIGFDLGTGDVVGAVLDLAVLGILIGIKSIHVDGRSLEGWINYASLHAVNFGLESVFHTKIHGKGVAIFNFVEDTAISVGLTLGAMALGGVIEMLPALIAGGGEGALAPEEVGAVGGGAAVVAC